MIAWQIVTFEQYNKTLVTLWVTVQGNSNTGISNITLDSSVVIYSEKWELLSYCVLVLDPKLHYIEWHWSFNTCGSDCWLKSVPGSTVSASCRTSGVKVTVLFADHPGGDLSSSTLWNNADATQPLRAVATGPTYYQDQDAIQPIHAGSRPGRPYQNVNPCGVAGVVHN